ncbi:MAG: membrane protein insertase YidC [Treponema sp.]|jgi:YidC/Oxa1 family membrane protein insertase|nr:membrane protein insertase YidC [Treponema sp.]
MRLGYAITGSYGLSILFFALAAKLITFPLTLSAQKNSIRLLQLQPELEHIRRTHYGDRERINEEQYQLYTREKYSPLSGLVPLLVQLLLLFGMVAVIRNPYEHIRSADFSSRFMGFDLNVQPFSGGVAPYALIAALSGTSSYLLCLVQNRLNPAQRRMRFWGKWGMSLVIIAFSLYFPLVMPGGIGLYWFFSNTLSIAAAFAANGIYNPQKLVAPELLIPPPKVSREERKAGRVRRRELTALENESVKRFYACSDANKLMFYSVIGGQYKYFSEIIDYVLGNSDIAVHYVTNDPDDKLLQTNRERFETYYIGEKKAITFMLNLHTVAMVVMTAPNLQQYHVKRSVVEPNIEYVFTYHHFTSLMILREGALDYFDTVLCVGQHQIEEIRRTEQLYNLPPKRLVKCGYGQIDKLLRMYAELPKRGSSEPQILIAPSWSGGNILDSCLEEIISLLVNDYKIIVRPHPEYIKRFPEKWQAITARFRFENLSFDGDFLSNDSIYQSDILITDWSNIAYEFSYCTKKPAIYINTPMKIMNSEYHKLGIEPLDVTLRGKLGVSIEMSNLSELPGVAADMLGNPDKYHETINSAIGEYLFYPGRSGEAGGRYIISRLIFP